MFLNGNIASFNVWNIHMWQGSRTFIFYCIGNYYFISRTMYKLTRWWWWSIIFVWNDVTWREAWITWRNHTYWITSWSLSYKRLGRIRSILLAFKASTNSPFQVLHKLHLKFLKWLTVQENLVCLKLHSCAF